MYRLYAFIFALMLVGAPLSAMADDETTADSQFTWTDEDVFTIFDAFHNTFLDTSRRIYMCDTAQPNASHRGNGARDNDYSGCAAAIWCQAPMFDMVINAARLAQQQENFTTNEKRQYQNLINRIYLGEKSHYTNFDFDDNNTDTGWFIYDDIMWWTVALAHAYAYDPETTDYLTYAEKSFCRVWYGSEKVGDTGSYSDPTIEGQTGGMYWEWQPINNPNPNTEGNYKSACINFPTVIAMATLYLNLPDDGRTPPTDAYPTYQTKEFYLEKAIEIYDWAKEHLVPSTNGRVADGMHGGDPEYSDHLYNQGTYIGASCLLYQITGDEQYLTNAKQAVTYSKRSMSTRNSDGVYVLKYESGYEQGIYAAIFAQYMDLFINTLGQGSHQDCLEWLRQNIQLGWENRDTTRDLNNGKFNEQTSSTETIESYGASALPALMLLFPAADAIDGISTVKAEDVRRDNVLYSIDGRALKANADVTDLGNYARGIYVLNGAKYVVR